MSYESSYVGFGIPNNRLTCMQDQKTHSFSYNMHLFLPYLLSDSQTIRSTINFSKFFPAWRWSALIGRFNLKQCLWAQCYFVYSVTVETDIFNATKVGG